MRKGFGWVAAIAMVLAATGGEALAAGPPPSGGTIAIETSSGGGSGGLALQAFADTASEILTARGFTVFDDAGHAASVVDLVVSREDVGTGLTKVPGQRSPSMMGLGVSVPLSTGDSREVALQRTRLEMRIHKRGEADAVWDGAAVTVREAGTKEGTDQTVASDLIRALLGAYPAQPRGVLGVP